jgi:hypothetical protein
MKTNELNENWEDHKDKIKLRLVELTKEDKMFSQEMKDDMYQKLQIVHEGPEKDFLV